MMRRVCAEPGCPNTTDGPRRCTSCRRQRELARGTSTARGYGYTHQRTRAAWVPEVRAGRALCRRCGLPITPTDTWDLGHPDNACPAPLGPEHVACNRATSGR